MATGGKVTWDGMAIRRLGLQVPTNIENAINGKSRVYFHRLLARKKYIEPKP